MEKPMRWMATIFLTVLSLVLAAASAKAEKPPADAAPELVAAQAAQIKAAEETGKQIEQSLQRGEWQAAVDAIEPAIARVLQGRIDAPPLARLVAYRALAESGLGRQEEAAWDWQVAQNLDAHPLGNVDPSSFSEVGKALVAHPLRQLGASPAGLDVHQVAAAAAAAAPGESTPGVATRRAQRLSGAAPEMPGALLHRSVRGGRPPRSSSTRRAGRAIRW